MDREADFACSIMNRRRRAISLGLEMGSEDTMAPKAGQSARTKTSPHPRMRQGVPVERKRAERMPGCPPGSEPRAHLHDRYRLPTRGGASVRSVWQEMHTYRAPATCLALALGSTR